MQVRKQYEGRNEKKEMHCMKFIDMQKNSIKSPFELML